jgi:hypothetical protein
MTMKKKPTTSKAVRASAPKPAPVRPLAPPPPPVVEGDPNLWQTLHSRSTVGTQETTSATEVPGGVLVKVTRSSHGGGSSVALCFVPGVKISGGKIVDVHPA